MYFRRLLVILLCFLTFNCKNPNLELEQAPTESAPTNLIESQSRSIAATDTTIIAYYDFEKELGSWYEKNMCCPWSIGLTGFPRRSGNSAMKVEVRKGDISNGPRSELGQAPNKITEGWFGFSLYFPSSFLKETSEESIVQWQAKPDLAIGEAWRSPPMLLGVLNDRFVLEIRSDTSKITVQGNFTFTRIDLGPVSKEIWHDWVFHVKWAHDHTGIVEVWKDKKLVVSRHNQPNSYNDDLSPYFKVGVYKWDWSNPAIQTVSDNRTMYVDEVTIGNRHSTFEKVSPGIVPLALPVKLISFTVAKAGKNAQLSWATTEEVNSEKFVIERSADARNWKSIGQRAAMGESTALSNYTFPDQAPLPGANYYRLKVVDSDGTFVYSVIKNLNF
jgi:hypothetical protein